MLKKEILELSALPKIKYHFVSIRVTEETHNEIVASAKEMGCNISKYLRTLHKFAQQQD